LNLPVFPATKGLHNFNPASLSLPPPLSLSPPSHLYKPSLIFLPSSHFLFYIDGEGQERESGGGESERGFI